MNKNQLDKTLRTIKNYVDSTKMNYLKYTSNVDVNTLKTTGIYSLPSNCTNNGTTNAGTLIVDFNVGTPYQLWIPDNTHSLYKRNWDKTNSKWNGWANTYTGNVTGSSSSCTGNAASATKLATARTISLTGDVTGSASFDGSANASITATVANDSHTHSTYLPKTGGTMTGAITSNVSTGTYLLTQGSGGIKKVTDQGGLLLHCDSSLFLHAGDNAATIAADAGAAAGLTSEHINLLADGQINIAVNTQAGYADSTKFTITTSGFSGNAASATKLKTGRKISLTGDVTGSATFDGSANASITTTVADNSHNHTSFTGALTIAGKLNSSLITTGNTQVTNGTGTSVYVGNPDTELKLESSVNPTIKIGSSTYTAYHTGNKPTLADIGAAASSHTHDYINHRDTRADNEIPDDVQHGLSIHLKTNGADGLSDGGGYHPAVHIKPWGDHSGGPYAELALTQNQNLWFRTSSSGTAWNAWKKVSLDGHTHNYAASSHNHTSLTGVTRINFASDSSDSAYIGSTVSDTTTSLDFGISDDGGTDKFRWISSIWNSSSESTNTYTAMSLLPGTTSANLYVTGNVNAEKGGRCYAYNADNSKSVSIGVGGSDVFITNSKSEKYLQLKDDGTLCYSDAKVALNYGTIERLTTTAWFYSTGDTGWYNSTYGGGWYMTDTSWLRAYNGKGVYTPGQIKCGDNFTLDTSGKAVIVKITGGSAYEGLKGGGDGICVGDNGTKLYLRHKTQINIENSSYTRKLANISSSGGVDMGDLSCRLSLHSNDNPIFWNGSNGYDVVTMSSMDAAHNKIRYGSGLGGANGYITFSW